MRLLLCLILFLVTFQNSFSNQNWQYRGTKNGITMIAAGGYEDSVGNQRMYDAFLDLLVSNTKSIYRKYKILLILDQPGIVVNSYSDWSATMAFDTLRLMDYDFIESYYYYRKGSSYKALVNRRNLPSDKYIFNLPEPIDINSAFDTNIQEMGLKIIYNYGESDSVTFFDRILTLVNYGINNLEQIKKEQKRIHLDYGQDKIKVSLVTIDTGLIKSLPLATSGFDHKSFTSVDMKTSVTNVIKKLIIGLSVILLLLILHLIRRMLGPAKVNKMD